MASSQQLYFYVPGQANVVDEVIEGVDGVRRGRYSSTPMEQLQLEHPGLVVCTRDEYYERARAAARQPPEEIDQAQFDELLNVLPPENWVRHGSSESFKLCEYYALDVTTICARVGDRYFRMRDRGSLRHDEIVATITAAGLLVRPAPTALDEPESSSPAP